MSTATLKGLKIGDTVFWNPPPLVKSEVIQGAVAQVHHWGIIVKWDNSGTTSHGYHNNRTARQLRSTSP